MILIQNGTLVFPGGSRKADLLIEGEKIARIGTDLDIPAGCSVVNASGKLVFPGFIDAHTHFDLHVAGTVTIDDFAKCQFQVGEVIACEAVKKSKKLLCSQVKIGSEVRQIVSGIRKYYSPEEMVGKKVMVITNLKPAKLAGLVSEGMILCAEAPDGSLALMVPEAGKNVPAGSEIG